jgi:hypothetical protein
MLAASAISATVTFSKPRSLTGGSGVRGRRGFD